MQPSEPGPLLFHHSYAELWLGLPQAAAPTTSQSGCGCGLGPADLGSDPCPWGDVLARPQHRPHGPCLAVPGLGLTLVVLYQLEPNLAAL